jgi:hypothetical protein
MLGSNPGLLRLWHWQSHALNSQLDVIHSRRVILSYSLCMFVHLGREGEADDEVGGGGEGAEDQGQGNYQIEGIILPNVVVNWFTMEFTYV